MKKKHIALALILWSLPLLPVWAFAVPDTGQTTCFDNEGNPIACPSPSQPFYGQDGNFLINPPSFSKTDSDKTVTDHATGLTWEVKTAASLEETVTQTEALAYIDQLNAEAFCGHRDWRLPTILELHAMADFEHDGPAVDTDFFPNTQKTRHYWSSTTSEVEGITRYYLLNFDLGHVFNTTNPDTAATVRAVRGAPLTNPNRYHLNMDNTVTDFNTGLIWELKTQENTSNKWHQHMAAAYCNDLEIGGYTDWRLPTIKELLTLIDYTSTEQPMLHMPVFTNSVIAFHSEISACYWSSTTSVTPVIQTGNKTMAWAVDIQHGVTKLGFKTSQDSSGDTFRVRAVRGGQALQPGGLVITSPKPGATWHKGDTMLITWENPSPEIPGNVAIAISCDGGKSFASITDDTPNDGAYSWTVTEQDDVNGVLKIMPLHGADAARGASTGIFYTECRKYLCAISHDDTTREIGSQAVIDVKLSTAPENTVAFDVTCSDSTEARVTPKALFFSSENWCDTQYVTVTGKDDTEADGNQDFYVNISINPEFTKDTSGFAALAPTQVSFTNIDDDTKQTDGADSVKETNGDTSGGCFIRCALTP
ncbi:Lcl C-terminal domain-containing protein [Desulfoluna spongiiphila]|uniref:Lcl C-terminal domain-containing protein n=1 Tax=Desulfoluna spongiiphila TaxID=419481 RepID=UPI0012591BEC|nr:DUF1566 domain-containing protein [Desulfoluna spongiiphila]VVS94656.1 protein of unknown function duf1566 [Desulfoluna spongiiphila]